MCTKKSLLSTFLILILGLTATSVSADTSDGLLGYWSLNEGAGTATADISGNENEGAIVGEPSWVPGKFGTALEFDGLNDRVDCGNAPMLELGTSDFAVSAWVKTTGGGEYLTVFAKGADNGGGIRYHATLWNSVARLAVDDDIAKKDPAGSIAVTDDQWHHIVWMRIGDNLRLYVDGVEDQAFTNHARSSLGSGYNITGTKYNAYIGCIMDNTSQSLFKFFSGLLDDVAIWNRALTLDEISYLWNEGEGNPVITGTPGMAAIISPAKDAEDVLRDGVVLEWKPGKYAVEHDVYLGTTFEDVNNATVIDAAYLRRQSETTCALNRLDMGQTYYWRVDEVSDASSDIDIYKGSVWKFTTEPYARTVPVGAISATASSSLPGQGPEKTVDLSGLEPASDPEALPVHSIDSAEMWLCVSSEPNGVWIQYEFNQAYKLDQMLVWNFNGEVFVSGFGLKDVTIAYSADGVDWVSFDDVFGQAPGKVGYNEPVAVVEFSGATVKMVRITGHSNWSSLYNYYGLSEVQFQYIPAGAREPKPESGATEVAVDTPLSWIAGREVSKHKVYLSTDEQSVTEGTVSAVTVDQPIYSPSLDLSTTYYWRVDEVNDAMDPSVWAGATWSFTTADKVVVDDFESYNDTWGYIVFQSWIDGYGWDDGKGNSTPGNGTGSAVGYWPAPTIERTIKYDGDQSMPLTYGAEGKNLSKATYVLPKPQPVNKHGITTLSLQVYGAVDNAPGQLFIEINGKKVADYPGSQDDLKQAQWHDWPINLAGKGITSIATMTIGVTGGSGTIYIDAIYLK